MRLTSRDGFSSACRSVKDGLLVVFGDELPVHMTGADAHFEHDRRVRGFRQFKALLDHAHKRRQIGARIEEPDLRFHRIGVAALLHDRGALAVVFADDDQRAAGDAARREVRERVGRDIGARGRFECHGAANRIHDGSRERRGGGGFRGGRLEMDAEIAHHVLGVGEHVHEMRDRRALIAGDVGHAGLKQGLGDRENALAAKDFAGSKSQVLNFALEGPFRHRLAPSGIYLHEHI